MSQTVYLNAPGIHRVCLEGPALRIQSRTEADRYLPLQRLARIICRGPVQWSTAALLNCLKVGVPVTFLDRDGRLQGLCVGAWPQSSRFSELLDAFFTLEDGPARLVNWFQSHSRSHLLKLLHRHQIDLPTLRVRLVRRHLRTLYRLRCPQGDPRLVLGMKPLLATQIVEILTSYRICPALLEPGHDWAGLVCYLSGVLEWDCWDLALGGKLQPAGKGYRATVACYQRHARQMDRLIRTVCERLWRWLEQSEAYCL